ncbi:MAG TPA: tyrosine-type recombinase/integrase [Streptosporangiaceae bacterium]|nr:tyrosine-type recombinase/integrase [Streptosporangiaceae bacterium]
MAGKTAKRRTPGEGGAFSYKTRAGLRWYWKASLRQPDGTKTPKVKGGFETKEAALGDMAEAKLKAKASNGQYAEPSKQPLCDYLLSWLDALRLAPSTVASYRKNVRLHVSTYLGAVPLADLTSGMLTNLYADLDASGRRDRKGQRTGLPLSARTVRYIHTIAGAALGAAVAAEPPLLTRNPAAKAKPPTAKQAAPPEMRPWSAGQLSAFLAWSAANSPLHTAWWVLAMTGMRRGELLALRWSDIDLASATIGVRRSVGIIRNKGTKAEVREGPTKTSRPRVVDIDSATVALLRSWKRERGSLALALARDDALVFGTLEGAHFHPERFSRTFKSTLARSVKALGDAAPPEIRLHDLRHTHATLLQRRGVASDATFRAWREDGAIRDAASGCGRASIATFGRTRRSGRP